MDAASHLADAEVMPLVIQAVERYGRDVFAKRPVRLGLLPQRDATLDWVIAELGRKQRGEGHGIISVRRSSLPEREEGKLHGEKLAAERQGQARAFNELLKTPLSSCRETAPKAPAPPPPRLTPIVRVDEQNVGRNDTCSVWGRQEVQEVLRQ